MSFKYDRHKIALVFLAVFASCSLESFTASASQFASVRVQTLGEWRPLAVGQQVVAPEIGVGPTAYWRVLPGFLKNVALEHYYLLPDATKRTAEDYAQLDFTMLSEGLVWLLAKGSGNLASLESKGWLLVARDIQAEVGYEGFGKNTVIQDWVLLERMCKLGEQFGIRTETYQAPVVLRQAPISRTYELVRGDFNWHEAKLDAERRGGHLATITSQQEWESIKAAIPATVLEGKVVWIGGTDNRTEGQWEWITGEPWGGFLNWRGGEPNGLSGGADSDYLEITQLPGSPWNDALGTERRQFYLLEYEYPPPWPKYQIVEGRFTWREARADAERRGGHLATITTAGEWSLVTRLFGNSLLGVFLGATDEQQEGTWKWITGEPWTFENWSGGQPDNSSGAQHYLWLHPAYGLKWDDTATTAGSESKYLLEFEAPISLNYGLVAHYPFNGTGIDASGNGYNGILNGVTLSDDRFGNSGQSLAFAGNATSFVRVPNKAPVFSASQISVSIWVNVDAGGSNNPRIFSKGWAVNALEGAVMRAAGETFNSVRLVNNLGSNGYWVNSKAALKTGQWYMLTFVDDGNQESIYVDGILDNTYVHNRNLVPTTETDLFFGKNSENASDYFAGKLDDVRVYNRTLSGLEIKALYDFEKLYPGPIPKPSELNYLSLQRLAFGQVQGLRIPISPPDRMPFVVETSPDLKAWTQLISFPTNSGPFEFIDSSATNYTIRFYRAVKR